MAIRRLGFQPLMQSIYTRLTTHSLTAAYTTYNYVPKNAVMPYVSFGAPIGVRSISFTTRDTQAEDNTVTVHVWSAAEGDKQASQYMDNIVQAVLGTDLAVFEYFAPFIAFLDMSELFIDDSVPTHLVRHGVMRFRFIMAPS
jgi:hypothetical protein